MEEIVNDVKFTIDILKRYSAIPPKMPDDEEKRRNRREELKALKF